MIPISEEMQKIHETIDRMIARSESPEYQAGIADLEAKDAALRSVREQNHRQRCRVSGHVPARLWQSLDDPQRTEALDAVRIFLEAPPACTFLILSGPAGVGKTFGLGFAVQERGGEYVSAQTLVTVGSFDPVWKDIGFASLLSLDELGAEKRNEAYDASLFALLDARYANQRKTVLATNLDAAAFKARYSDDRLYDRLKKAGEWVYVGGSTMRLPWKDA
jgi:DNA replication protein DnaC